MKTLRKTYQTLCGTALLLLIVGTSTTFALPRFSLQYGQRCASCHVNVSGGGQRTESGWWSMKNTGLIRPEGTFLSPLYSAESNTIGSPMVSWGFDYRMQMAKRRDDAGDITRQFFSMQLAPYVTYKPVEALSVYGTVNIVEAEYPAQQAWFGGITYTPTEMLTVKAGFIQPDFGVRHDDHTIFTRIHGGIGYVPFYAEWGGAAYVSPLEWLTVSGGAYSSHNRHDAVADIASDGVFYTGNLQATIPDFDRDLSYQAGLSSAWYDGQTLYGGHAGVGWLDRGTLFVEYVHRNNEFTSALGANLTYTGNADVLLVKISADIIDGLSFTGRWEQAQTNYNDLSDGSASFHAIERQWAAGFQIFVLPNVELRPEYRWLDTPYYTIGQYTAQLHLFY